MDSVLAQLIRHAFRSTASLKQIKGVKGKHWWAHVENAPTEIDHRKEESFLAFDFVTG